MKHKTAGMLPGYADCEPDARQALSSAGSAILVVLYHNDL
jgi:hypothetical protein